MFDRLKKMATVGSISSNVKTESIFLFKLNFNKMFDKIEPTRGQI